MRFEVRAYDNGRIASFVVDAVSREDAMRQIVSRALHPIDVRDLRHSAWSGRSVGFFDAQLFAQELLALLEAGLSIITATETLMEREKLSVSRSVLARIVKSLREGKSFASALEAVPEVFSLLFVGVVRSAERTGNLTEVLERFIDYRRRVDGLRTKIVNAAIYPSLLLCVALAVTLFLGGYVVPRFASVYKGTGRSLPWASQLLLDWGSLVGEHAPLLSVILILLCVAGVVGVKLLARHGGIARIIRALPFVAENVRVYELSRLYLTLGMLLDSGLPAMSALVLTENALPIHQRELVQQAGRLIRNGDKFSSAFESSGLTTSVGLRMLKVGEESGRLGEMMTRTARFHDEETGRWIERFSRVAEPTLMVGIGLLIGGIVVLLYMPVFDLAGSLR